IAGTALTGLQALKVYPLIFAAEVFEDAGQAESNPVASSHSHEQGNQLASGHKHGDEGEEWAPADGGERLLFSLLANVLIGVALGLVLAAIFALRHVADWRQGVVWGVGGFIAVNLAPAFGLPPELPGMPAGELLARQTWWLATALLTACGIAAVFLSRGMIWRVGGVVLIALPHFIGAPHPATLESGVPANLAADFATASLATNLVFWAILGILTAEIMARLARPSEPELA
ncbi:MAG: cobalt transporter, partial [Rhodospirillaceae bacterium]|nr:cobalt transporter [Rhodospirillaceae bacterium]